MKIKDLKANQKNAEILAEVVDLGIVREFLKFGKPGRVCSAIIKDDSGKCSLTLWNEQIDLVSIGDKIKISNGFVSEWKGNLQISTGRNGTLEIVQKSSSSQNKSDEANDLDNDINEDTIIE